MGCLHPPHVVGMSKVSHWLCSVQGHRNKLQGDLQMAATCAGLEDAQASPGCEPSLLVIILGQLHMRYGASWSQMLLMWKNLGKSEVWAETSHSYSKATENSLGGPKSWVRKGLMESPGQGKQCEPGWWSLRYDICLLTLWLCRGGLRKGTMASARKLSHDARQFSSSPYVSDVFQSAAPTLELRGSKSK